MSSCRATNAKARAVHRPTRGVPNKTEAAYRDQLEFLRQSGLIHAYAFEALRLRLAPATGYTPDFLVITNHGEVELHEVKGWMRDDANAKLKIAAELYPYFRFRLVRQTAKRDGGGWNVEDVA